MYTVNIDIDPVTIYSSVKGLVVYLIESTSTPSVGVDAKGALNNIIVKVSLRSCTVLQQVTILRHSTTVVLRGKSSIAHLASAALD